MSKLVTDLWFTALNRIMVWRFVFTMSAITGLAQLVLIPIIWHSIDKFGEGWRVTWIVIALLIVFSAWRWHHWRQVQKDNIWDAPKRETNHS
jgi:hypothetical protein